MHWTSKSCLRSPAVSLYKFIYSEAKYKRPSWNCNRSDSVPHKFCHEIALFHTEYPSTSIEPQKAVTAVSHSAVISSVSQNARLSERLWPEWSRRLDLITRDQWLTQELFSV